MMTKGRTNLWIAFTDLFLGLALFLVGGTVLAVDRIGDLTRPGPDGPGADVVFSEELKLAMNNAAAIAKEFQRNLARRLPEGIEPPQFGETEVIIPSAALFRSFGYDDFLNDPSKRGLLVAIGEALRDSLNSAGERRRYLKVVIEGHTDDRPIKSTAITKAIPTNWELSSRRATGVLRFLEQLGMEASGLKLIAVGLADTIPVASNQSEDGRAQNRRIVIRVEPDVAALREYVRTQRPK